MKMFIDIFDLCALIYFLDISDGIISTELLVNKYLI